MDMAHTTLTMGIHILEISKMGISIVMELLKGSMEAILVDSGSMEFFNKSRLSCMQSLLFQLNINDYLNIVYLTLLSYIITICLLNFILNLNRGVRIYTHFH